MHRVDPMGKARRIHRLEVEGGRPEVSYHHDQHSRATLPYPPRLAQRLLGTFLTVTKDEIFEASQLLCSDRATRVHLTRRNPDLGTHAEFAAI